MSSLFFVLRLFFIMGNKWSCRHICVYNTSPVLPGFTGAKVLLVQNTHYLKIFFIEVLNTRMQDFCLKYFLKSFELDFFWMIVITLTAVPGSVGGSFLRAGVTSCRAGGCVQHHHPGAEHSSIPHNAIQSFKLSLTLLAWLWSAWWTILPADLC